MERRKNVLITGASGGIGRAMAEAFAEKGYGVAMACWAHPQRAQDVANRIGARVFACDITREEEVDALFSAAEEAYGFIDAVVNNAGVSWRGLLTDMTLEEWERVFAVNTRGVFLCCRRALPWCAGSGGLSSISAPCGGSRGPPARRRIRRRKRR